MGTPSIAAQVLASLIEAECNIVAVVTQPDKPIGRKQVLQASPVKELALKHNLKVLQPRRIRKEYQELCNIEADLIITCAYGQIVPKEVLEHPHYGCVNTHASLLPKYRGAAPIQRAILNGEKVTGMSLMYMNEKMDEGDIILQKELIIEDSDTTSSLFEKMGKLASEMLLTNLDYLCSDKVKRIVQEHSLATYAAMLSRDDEKLDLNKSAIENFNQIRALSEQPGAYVEYAKQKYKLFKASYDLSGNEANTFVGLIDNKLAFGCGEGTLYCEMIQPAGKKTMSAKDFFNGKGRSLVGVKFNNG